MRPYPTLTVGLLLLPLVPEPGRFPRQDPFGAFEARFESPPAAPPAQPAPRACAPADPFPYFHLASGEVRLQVEDLRIPGVGLDFVWARKYRSRLGPASGLGHGWDYSYDLWFEPADGGVRVHDGNTRRDLYSSRPDGTFVAHELFREGQFEADGRFTLRFADGGRWVFRPLSGSAAGRIESIVDRNDNHIDFAYGSDGRLASIADTLGRAIAVSWTGDRIASITDFAGRTVSYSYYADADPGGSAGDLRSATSPAVLGTPHGNDFPAGKTTTYTYSEGFADERLNHNLLSVTDPLGRSWLWNEYAPTTAEDELLFDRVVRQRLGSPDATIELSYHAAGPLPAGEQAGVALVVVVNDRVGNVSEHSFDRRGRRLELRQYTGRADPAQFTTLVSNRPTGKLRPDDPDFYETRWTYDRDALVRREVAPNGTVVERRFEHHLDPFAPWTARGNLRELRRLPGSHQPAGDQPAGVIELFEYAPGFGGCCGSSFVSRYTDPRGHVTTHVYDARGNRIQTQHPVLGVVEDWTYDSAGRVTSHTLPGNDSGWRRRDELRWYGPADGVQNGYLKELVVDAGGLALTTRRSYDTAGNLVQVIDPNGHERRYDVNALNQIVRVLSPELWGAGPYRIAEQYWYDAADRLVRVDVENRDEYGTPVAGNPEITTAFEHGLLGELLRVSREYGAAGEAAVTEYAYDGNLNRVLERRPEAVLGDQPHSAVAWLHDERDLLFREVHAPGSAEQSTTQLDYDGNGNLRARREGLEAGPGATTFAYDALDRPVLETDVMGNRAERHYDPCGNEGGLSGGDGSAPNPFALRVLGELQDDTPAPGTTRLYEVQYAYDALDRRIAEEVRHFDTQDQAPIGDGQSRTLWSYSPSSQVVTEAGDGPGQVTTFAYDTAYRLEVVTDAQGNTFQYNHDPKGNVVRIVQTEVSDLGTPPRSFTTWFSFDALDRKESEIDGVGNAAARLWDSRGNVVQAIDALGRASRWEYDGAGRMVRAVHDADGNGAFGDDADVVVQHAWDANGRRIATTDDRGHVTRYAYDGLDRPIVTRLPDGTLQQVGTGAVWPAGAPRPDLSGFQSGYDGHGDVRLRTDARGTVTEASYDALHRVVTRAISPGPEVVGTLAETYRYDGLSRLVRAQDDDSRVTRGSASTSGYDSLGHVLRETQQLLSGGPTRTVMAAYDGGDNQIRLVYPGGRAIVRSFDLLDRPKLVRDDPPQGGATVATCFWFGPERLERIERGNGTRTTFAYDGQDGQPNAPDDFGFRRIVEVSHEVAASGAVLDRRTYAWSPTGGKTLAHDVCTGETRSYAYDALDRLVRIDLGWTVETYELDGAGNRTFASGPGDSGTYAADAVDAYATTPFDLRTYDLNGNLASATSPDRVLRYDYRNQLVEHEDLPSGWTASYRYDCLGRRIETSATTGLTRHYYDGAQEIEEQDLAGATLATYAYADRGSSLLQMERAGQRFHVHADELGSSVALTDGAGALVQRVAYSDFGAPDSGHGAGLPFLFAGLRWDPDSRTYLTSSGPFEPRTGRLLARAPYGPDALSNPYTVLRNAPQTSLAPSPGLAWGFYLFCQDADDDSKSRLKRAKDNALEAAAFLGALETLWKGLSWVLDILQADCGPVDISVSAGGDLAGGPGDTFESLSQKAMEQFRDAIHAKCRAACDGQCHGQGELCTFKELTSGEWDSLIGGSRDRLAGGGIGAWSVKWGASGVFRCSCKCEK